MSDLFSPAPLIVSSQTITNKTLPAKTSVLCPVVRLGVLIEDCSSFQDINFLIDTSSQISLIDSLFITKIHKPKINLRVSSISSKVSFLGSNVNCKISFPNDQICSASLISKDKISLSMEVAQVDRAFHNLHNSPFPVSGNRPLYNNDLIQIHGILECGLIPLLGILELCEIEGGSLLRLSNGYTLFGDVSFIASAVPSALMSPQPSQSQLDPPINGSPHYPQIRDLKGSKPLKARVKFTNPKRTPRQTNRTKSMPLNVPTCLNLYQISTLNLNACRISCPSGHVTTNCVSFFGFLVDLSVE